MMAPHRRTHGFGACVVLTLALTSGIETEPNDTPAAAQPILPGTWYAAEIDPDHEGPARRDVDVYRLDEGVARPHTVRLDAPQLKTLVIRDAEGSAVVTDAGPELARETSTSSDGPLFIEVSGQHGPYRLCVEGPGTTCWSGVHRIAGPNPYARAAELSSTLPTHVEGVVLAGRSPAELAVAASLAAQARTPLLALPPGGLSQPVGLELIRLRPEGIVGVGGAESVPDTVIRTAAAFSSIPDPVDITLVRGESTVQVAAEASRRFPILTPVAYVLGTNDAAGAINTAVLLARVGGPVLITGADEVPAETAQALARLSPRQIIVVGDRRAVSDDVARQLGRYGVLAGVPVARIDADPRETSLAVAARFPEQVSMAYVVSLADPAGALAASVLAARAGAPVLVTGFQLTDEVEDELARLHPEAVFVVGGTDTIGPDTEERVFEAVRIR